MEHSGTVDKALRALELLRRARGPLALAELAGGLEMPKATVHRLLASLLTHEVVEQRTDGRYALGVGLVRLGLGAQGVDPVARVCRAELERAAAQLGETFFLVVARAGRLVVLDKVEGSGVLRAAPEMGATVPTSVTATGRLYQGLAPELLTRPTAGTPDREKVAAAVRRGYDINSDEWIDGLTVVAAPIRGARTLYGCIACAVASARFSRALRSSVVEQTKSSAAAVARKLEAEEAK